MSPPYPPPYRPAAHQAPPPPAYEYPPPPYGQQPPYPNQYAQPYMPAFPPMYASPYGPGYAPMGGMPYGIPSFGPPRSAKPTVAGVFWIIVLLRTLGFIVAVSIWWFESSALGFPLDFPFALVDDPAAMLVILMVGLGATVAAMVSDFTRSNHFIGTVAGAVATAACVTPGLLFGFGVLGVPLGVIAVVLHVVSKNEFKPSSRAAEAQAAAPAP